MPDIAPTILELAGVKTSAISLMDGKSLMPLLHGDARSSRSIRGISSSGGDSGAVVSNSSISSNGGRGGRVNILQGAVQSPSPSSLTLPSPLLDVEWRSAYLIEYIATQEGAKIDSGGQRSINPPIPQCVEFGTRKLSLATIVHLV